jgi:outer membrane protein assembly factor BamA
MKGGDEQVRVVFNVNKEGAKGIINDILVNGVTGDGSVQENKRAAIKRAVPLHPGEALRADRITEAERMLYVTDAYRQVLVSQQPVGDGPNGTKALRRDHRRGRETAAGDGIRRRVFNRPGTTRNF